MALGSIFLVSQRKFLRLSKTPHCDNFINFATHFVTSEDPILNVGRNHGGVKITTAVFCQVKAWSPKVVDVDMES